MYYVLLPDLDARTAVIAKLKALGVHSVFHYIPLHSAPAGRKYARAHGELAVTDSIADRLLRLPMWVGLEDQQAEVIQAVLSTL
jgi:dTDP-4-amino-4,6-dideoxygalactose transaminase